MKNNGTAVRQIYIINTYYQLITALHMKMNLYPEAVADLVLTDRSSGASAVLERLRSLDVFENVYFARITSDTIWNKIEHGVRILFDNNGFVTKNSDVVLTSYDEMYFYNYNYYTCSLFYLLKEKNPDMVCHRFEEGFGSYFSYFIGTGPSLFFQDKAARFFRHPSFLQVDNMYFYEPDFVLFHDDCKIRELPKPDRTDFVLRDTVKKIFGASGEGEYDRKYIFFEGPYMRDGVEIDDLELVLHIADVVGPENMMVKLHPRTLVDRFSEYGIKTNQAVGIPWEAVVLDNDFSDCVFLTITSGSVLSPRILFNQQIPTYMLFNCTKVKAPIVDKNFAAYLERFEKKYGQTGFYIPSSADELICSLRQNAK